MSKPAMINPNHQNALVARHEELESRLAIEVLRPQPDSGILARLKKAKLQIKDALLGHR